MNWVWISGVTHAGLVGSVGVGPLEVALGLGAAVGLADEVADGVGVAAVRTRLRLALVEDRPWLAAGVCVAEPDADGEGEARAGVGGGRRQRNGARLGENRAELQLRRAADRVEGRLVRRAGDADDDVRPALGRHLGARDAVGVDALDDDVAGLGDLLRRRLLCRR